MPTLAVLKLDQIGDYVIFRNFLEEIRKSKKYSGYKIVLIGNIVYKSFAQALDGEFIDKFIGVNKRNYRKYSIYRKFIANEINAQKVDVLISPTYSRDAQWVENIVKSVNAAEKIGSSGDGTNITLGQKREADRRYTTLIAQNEKPMFEFDRYKEFFEKLFGSKIGRTSASIEAEDVEKARLVGFFPGAGAKYRRWSPENFAKAADFIKEKYGYKICILGSKQDKKIAKAIMEKSSADFIDMTGKLPLEKLPRYCKKLQFVLTNDTAGFHISAAVGTKTICISNGNNYPRFVDYPDTTLVKAVYPDEAEQNLSNAKYVRDNLLYGSIIDINKVSVKKVTDAIASLAETPKKAAKKTAEKTTAKKTTVKKAAAKKTTTKAAATKTTKTTKTTVKKASAAKKVTAKKTTAKKTASKTTTTKRTTKKEA